MTIIKQLLSKEIIKPSTPTPPHLRNLKLSLLDQLTNGMYMPTVLYFACNHNDKLNRSAKSRLLKQSLSQLLSHYYHFAGRLSSSRTDFIHCNDEGVEFFEAQIQSNLSDFLKLPQSETEELVFPGGIMYKKPGKESLLKVQVSFFDCGGVAVGICISHKIVDGCSFIIFLYNWGKMSCKSGEIVPPKLEYMVGKTIFTAPEDPLMVPNNDAETANCGGERFAFGASNIAKLRAMATSARVQDPTRVEVVTAFLYKCAIDTSLQPSTKVLLQLVNMRRRVVPPLPENCVGNYAWFYSISPRQGTQMTLQALVGQLRKGLSLLCDENVKNLEMEEWVKAICDFKRVEDSQEVLKDVDIYVCTSTCRFSFYKVNFGWGEPICIRMASGAPKNSFFLMDTREGDGIEAWVTLDKQHMMRFQQHQGLLRFASFAVDSEQRARM
ncbi:Deacetylvindoline O-acetyltransferase [Bertholletia excelsa]